MTLLDGKICWDRFRLHLPSAASCVFGGLGHRDMHGTILAERTQYDLANGQHASALLTTNSPALTNNTRARLSPHQPVCHDISGDGVPLTCPLPVTDALHLTAKEMEEADTFDMLEDLIYCRKGIILFHWSL